MTNARFLFLNVLRVCPPGVMANTIALEAIFIGSSPMGGIIDYIERIAILQDYPVLSTNCNS